MRFVAVLILAAVSVAAHAQSLTKIKIGIFPYLSNVVYKIAQDEGYFREQGVEAELVPFRTTTDFLPLLIKGDLDVAAPLLIPAVFNAVNQGAPLKMVLPLNILSVEPDTSYAFVARKADVASKKLAAPASWRGLKIGSVSARNGATSYLIAQFLKGANLKFEDVQHVALDTTIMPDALAKGQVDIAVATEPQLSRILARGDISLLFGAEPLSPNLPITSIAFGARLLKDRDTGARVTAALLKALAQYREGKTARNVKLVVEFTGLDEETVREMRWADTSKDGTVDARPIVAYEQWAFGQGVLDRVVPPEEFWDSTFLAAAQKRLSR